jgi:hypothetical protein
MSGKNRLGASVLLYFFSICVMVLRISFEKCVWADDLTGIWTSLYADHRHSPCVQVELYAGVRTRVGLLYTGCRVEQGVHCALPSVRPLLSFGPCAETSRYSQACDSKMTIGLPSMRVKHCSYGHSVATLLNSRGVATVFHKYSRTVASHKTVVVAVPSDVHYPANYYINYII